MADEPTSTTVLDINDVFRKITNIKRASRSNAEQLEKLTSNFTGSDLVSSEENIEVRTGVIPQLIDMLDNVLYEVNRITNCVTMLEEAFGYGDCQKEETEDEV